MDIKTNLAKNLGSLRKINKMTQLELAEKLNYSDKAISKWERGEAVPDICVLKELADLYGVTIDALISEPKEKPVESFKNLPKKRVILSLVATVIVWLVATVLYAFSSIFAVDYNWLFFIFSVPITNVILLLMWSYWGKTKATFFISSSLNWTIVSSLYITLKILLISPPASLWLIVAVGVPIQILLTLLFFYKKLK